MTEQRDSERNVHAEASEPDAVGPPPAPPARARRRWIRFGFAMAVVWLAADVALESINRATGLVGPLRPWSFLIGPAAAVATGILFGLRGRGAWVRTVLLAVGLYVLALVPLTLLARRDGDDRVAGPPGGEWTTVDFGLGGGGCDLTGRSRTFHPGDPVVAAAEFQPPIRAGDTIVIRFTRDGSMEPTYPVVQVADTSWACVYGAVSKTRLEAGHYHWEIEVSGSTMPPAGGDFTVDGS